MNGLPAMVVPACLVPEPEVEQMMASYMQTYTEADQKEDAQKHIAPLFGPVLQRHCAGLTNLRMLEVGAGPHTIMPELVLGSLKSYTSLDYGRARLEMQKRFISKNERLASIATCISGNVHKLPLPSGSFDFAVANCVNPFCGPNGEVRHALTEMARVLKTGGKFFLHAWHFEDVRYVGIRFRDERHFFPDLKPGLDVHVERDAKGEIVGFISFVERHPVALLFEHFYIAETVLDPIGSGHLVVLVKR